MGKNTGTEEYHSDGKEDKKLQWHSSFYGALHLEFVENKDDLEFTEEFILNTMPLRVDTLVIKKKRNCVIKNEIGRLFRTHNLIEYKSPNDALNYDTFLKGLAYAYLYKAGERYADSVWEIVTVQNKKLIEDMRRDDKVCKAMAELFKPEIDAAKAETFDTGFNDGFNNGFNNGLEEACIRMITAKLKKGKSTEEIAENLEMTVDEVNRLIGIINATA